MMKKKTLTSQETIILNKLAALKKSKFRSKFKLAQKERDYIAAKGLGTIKDHAFQFVVARAAPDFPKNDGKQTPMRGHPVSLPNMRPPRVVVDAFKSGMPSRRAGCWMRRRFNILWH